MLPNPIASPLLLNNAKVTGPNVPWNGGMGVMTACGTWDGATVTLQYLGPDNVTWITAGAATTLTANGNGAFYLPAATLRALVAGGDSSTAIYASVGLVP